MKDYFYDIFSRYENDILSVQWDKKEGYIDYLAQTFYYVSHSSRIMSIVAGHLPEKHEETHKAILKHASEERGHQFAALKDLERLGAKIDQYPEHPETRMFWEPQYYKAQFSPLDFYGYALMLEGTAVLAGRKILEKVEPAHGTKACGFLRLHCEEDPAHLDMLFNLFNKYNESELIGIRNNCHQSFKAYYNMLRVTLGESAKKEGDQNAA
ncbi:MAG: iron-containing redox enzyme family protein [Bdellovibrionales bacterium]|nr:iron-containing redox enzyme family protein [Bdellovibrionales bacterium]